MYWWLSWIRSIQIILRDSLILANFLSNSIERMVTFDEGLLNVKQLLVGGKRLEIKLPMGLY